MLQFVQRVSLVAILMSGLRFEVLTLNMNSERVVAVLVAGYLAARFLTGIPIRFTPPSWAYLGWLVTAFVSAAFAGFAKHINGILISSVPFVYYILFMQRTHNDRDIFAFIGMCLTITSIASILVFAIWSTTGAFAFMIDRDRIQLLMPEPNILAATLVALLLMYTMGSSSGVRKILVSGLTLIAIILAGSKMPIAAYVCGMAYIFTKTKALKSLRFISIGALTLIMTAFLVILFNQEISDIYTDKFARQDAIYNRMHGLELAWNRFLQNPILGNGPLSFSFAETYILTQMGTESERNMWIWQIWLAVAHDEGLIGLILFVTFLVMSWVSARQNIRKGYMPYIGLSAAIIAITLTSQTTTTHLAAIFGLVLGMANALLGHAEKARFPHRVPSSGKTEEVAGTT